MAASLFKLVGDIYVNNDEANKSIAKTDEKAESLGQKFVKGAGQAAKWGTAIAGGAMAAAGALVKVASSASEVADEIDKSSIRMGISTDSYQELKYAAEQCGVEMSVMEKAAKKLEGTDISFDDAIESIMSLGTEAERTQKAQELFGDSIAYTLAPMLQSSGEDFNGLRERAHELGIVMAEEDVKAGVQMGDTMSDVKKAVGGLVTQLGSKLMPTVQKVLDTILKHLPKIEEMFDQLAPIVVDLLDAILPVLLDLAETVLPPLMDLVSALLPPISELAKAIIPVLAKVLATVITPVAKLVEVLLPPLISLITPIIDILNPILDVISTLLKPLLDLLDLALTPIKLILDPISKAFKGLGDIISDIAKPFEKLGELLSGLKFPSIEPPKWVKKLLGIDDGEIVGRADDADRDTHTQNILKGLGVLKAGGGVVESGQVFVARENGLPEMVGQFGNTTGVANNEQITKGIAMGVAEAMQPVEALLGAIYGSLGNFDRQKFAKALAPYMDVQLGALKG